MNKQEQIARYMQSLKISEEEANQLWEDDQEDYIGEEGEEMSAKAKEVKRYEKSAEPKEKVKREIKKDDEKMLIIGMLYDYLSDNDEELFINPTIANIQKEITFKVGESEYSLNLVKHRPPRAGTGKK